VKDEALIAILDKLMADDPYDAVAAQREATRRINELYMRGTTWMRDDEVRGVVPDVEFCCPKPQLDATTTYEDSFGRTHTKCGACGDWMVYKAPMSAAAGGARTPFYEAIEGAKVEDKPARDEAECPTCHRNNDRGVDKCWNCSRPDPYPQTTDGPYTWGAAMLGSRVVINGKAYEYTSMVKPSRATMQGAPQGIAPPTQQPAITGYAGLPQYGPGHYNFAPTQPTQPAYSMTITDKTEAAMLATSYLQQAADTNEPDVAIQYARRAVEILEGIK
jgi:hypothetical protein